MTEANLQQVDFLSLSFLACPMALIIPASLGCVEDKMA
jgi:hypothetical protein